MTINDQKAGLAVKPFLKWAGGKRSILDELNKRLPDDYKDYNEPFLGGGALYFAKRPERASLSDINSYLVITYLAVRDDVSRLIRNLRIHSNKHSKEYFLKARARLPKEPDRTKIAALFIYLNKTCFNGLYRVNRSGQFNVPIGQYNKPNILDEENLRNASATLQDTKIVEKSFEKIEPKKGSFYYLDPPYHDTYSSYYDDGFDTAAHEKLAFLCKTIDEKGGYFMLSNSDTKFVKSLYKNYNIEEVSASRSISCKSQQRGKANELIIRNYLRHERI